MTRPMAGRWVDVEQHCRRSFADRNRRSVAPRWRAKRWSECGGGGDEGKTWGGQLVLRRDHAEEAVTIRDGGNLLFSPNAPSTPRILKRPRATMPPHFHRYSDRRVTNVWQSDKSALCSRPPRRRSSRRHRPAEFQTHGRIAVCLCLKRIPLPARRLPSKWPEAGFMRRFP